WYAGAKLGWSQYHDVGNNQINNAGPTSRIVAMSFCEPRSCRGLLSS
ncbi:hypothetical protein, partial [Enterobacter asburiae]